jgi:hypothetical protein
MLYLQAVGSHTLSLSALNWFQLGLTVVALVWTSLDGTYLYFPYIYLDLSSSFLPLSSNILIYLTIGGSKRGVCVTDVGL